MTEEAMNLVSKLIEEDGHGGRRLGGALGSMTQLQQQAILASISASQGNKMPPNDLSRSHSLPAGGGSSNQTHPSQNIPPSNSSHTQQHHAPSSNSSHPQQHHAPPSPVLSPASFDVWFYRDPQGSVQGPFTTQEMGLWCSQGYFNGTLQLRRECDKVFITLLELGKIYGRNPFVPIPDASPPPPIQAWITTFYY